MTDPGSKKEEQKKEEQKSVFEMSRAEYAQFKKQFLNAEEQRERELYSSVYQPPADSKSAFDMTPEEYAAAREIFRRSTLY